MVILSSPRILESVCAVHIRAPINSEKFSAMSQQFIPWLKYHNPKIQWRWEAFEESGGGQSGTMDVVFSDNSVTTIDEKNHECFHEICQALLDLNTEKSVK